MALTMYLPAGSFGSMIMPRLRIFEIIPRGGTGLSFQVATERWRASSVATMHYAAGARTRVPLCHASSSAPARSSDTAGCAASQSTSPCLWDGVTVPRAGDVTYLPIPARAATDREAARLDLRARGPPEEELLRVGIVNRRAERQLVPVRLNLAERVLLPLALVHVMYAVRRSAVVCITPLGNGGCMT